MFIEIGRSSIPSPEEWKAAMQVLILQVIHTGGEPEDVNS